MYMIYFEWDRAKSRSNWRKHGVSFEEAKSVFYDDHAIQFYDEDHSEQEDRFLMLGLSHQSRILMVCHCEQSADQIRIISARKATRSERRFYKGPMP